MIEMTDSPIGALLRPEVEEMIHGRRFTELREVLSELTPVDVADILRVMEPEDRAVAFRVLNKAQAADIFEYLPPDEQEELVHRLGQAEVAAILNEMAPDDRTALLQELPGAVTQRLIASLSPDERAIAQRLLGYPEESIGRRMTPDYVAVRKEWTVAQSFAHIRKVGKDSETLNVLYVTDERGKLLDDIRLRDFVLAPENGTIADLMDERYVALQVTDDQELAVQAFKKHDRSALPVVDSAGTLVGIVTVDDVLDVAEQEETEDVQKMAAVAALEAPYLDTSFLTMVKKRAGWLLVLFVGELFTATAVGYFEHEIATAVFLAVFMPLIISSGGNSGSQAASLVIRAMAVGEVALKDWWRVMRRELASGLMLGCILGTVAFARVMAIPPKIESPAIVQKSVELTLGVMSRIGITVGIAVIGVVVWGTLAGSMLPFIMRRLGFDPASSSAPFVATLVDVTGIVIYFLTALMMLKGTLL